MKQNGGVCCPVCPHCEDWNEAYFGQGTRLTVLGEFNVVLVSKCTGIGGRKMPFVDNVAEFDACFSFTVTLEVKLTLGKGPSSVF